MDYVTVEQMVKEAKENLHEFSVEDVKKNGGEAILTSKNHKYLK